jgi:hypothetical protein
MKQSILDVIRKFNPSISPEDFVELEQQVQENMDKEPPPQIAFIGETGVGKSTTLNTLFNAGVKTSHIKACTQEELALEFQVENGTLIVYDMPGLGESLASKDKHYKTYQRILKNVDVILWILDAQYRPIQSIQTYLRDEMNLIDSQIVERMVFALNKVDLVQPRQWHHLSNLPGDAQKNNIEARIEDVREKISEVLPSWKGTVIGYSAEKYYNLPQLFLAMLEAVPEKRRWVLSSRKALADFLEKVDDSLLPPNKQKNKGKTGEDIVRGIIDNMSPEERKKFIEGDPSILSQFGEMISGLFKQK